MIDKTISQFEQDFRDYLEASIAYAEVQEPYQALSSEDEITWLKNYITKTLQAERQKREEVVELLAELIPQQQECASGCGCSHHESYHPGGSCVWQPKEYYHADELEMLFKALTQPNNPN